MKCCFVSEPAEKTKNGHFDATVVTGERYSGLAIHCSAWLLFNGDTFECDSTDGAFVEKETGGSAEASHADKIPVLNMEVAEVFLNLAARKGEETTQRLLHLLHSRTFHVEVFRKFFE